MEITLQIPERDIKLMKGYGVPENKIPELYKMFVLDLTTNEEWTAPSVFQVWVEQSGDAEDWLEENT